MNAEADHRQPDLLERAIAQLNPPPSDESRIPSALEATRQALAQAIRADQHPVVGGGVCCSEVDHGIREDQAGRRSRRPGCPIPAGVRLFARGGGQAEQGAGTKMDDLGVRPRGSGC